MVAALLFDMALECTPMPTECIRSSGAPRPTHSNYRPTTINTDQIIDGCLGVPAAHFLEKSIVGHQQQRTPRFRWRVLVLIGLSLVPLGPRAIEQIMLERANLVVGAIINTIIVRLLLLFMSIVQLLLVLMHTVALVRLYKNWNWYRLILAHITAHKTRIRSEPATYQCPPLRSRTLWGNCFPSRWTSNCI